MAQLSFDCYLTSPSGGLCGVQLTRTEHDVELVARVTSDPHRHDEFLVDHRAEGPMDDSLHIGSFPTERVVIVVDVVAQERHDSLHIPPDDAMARTSSDCVDCSSDRLIVRLRPVLANLLLSRRTPSRSTFPRLAFALMRIRPVVVL